MTFSSEVFVFVFYPFFKKSKLFVMTKTYEQVNEIGQKYFLLFDHSNNKASFP